MYLPGSANLFGGRGATFKNISQNTIQAMKFPGAPHSLKMACGENPKRVYGNRRQSPSTRMGNMAGYRSAWIDAVEYTDGMNENQTKIASHKRSCYGYFNGCFKWRNTNSKSLL